MNKLTIIGNLTRDPESRTTPNGNNVCTFTVAVNRRRSQNSNQPEADFFRVSASAFQGQDGSPRASLEVFAEDVEFLSSRSDDGAAYTPAAPASKPAASVDNGFKEVDDEDLPF